MTWLNYFLPSEIKMEFHTMALLSSISIYFIVLMFSLFIMYRTT